MTGWGEVTPEGDCCTPYLHHPYQQSLRTPSAMPQGWDCHHGFSLLREVRPKEMTSKLVAYTEERVGHQPESVRDQGRNCSALRWMKFPGRNGGYEWRGTNWHRQGTAKRTQVACSRDCDQQFIILFLSLCILDPFHIYHPRKWLCCPSQTPLNPGTDGLLFQGVQWN